MSSNTSTSPAKFERMTKEEKLRFCQDLIKQAANLAKPSSVSGIRSTGSKSSVSGTRSKSKLSKRPASTSDLKSKKTKSGTSTDSGRSKSQGKSGTSKRSRSKSSVKPSASNTVCYFIFLLF
jgi:hypothetical protein